MRPLNDAYFEAIYRVQSTPARVIAFSRSPIAATNAPIPPTAPWCIITAHNPGSRRLSDAENEARDRALFDQLRKAGHEPVRTIASDHTGEWPEAGWLFTPADRHHALTLARAFAQRAVVYGRGVKVGLLVTSTEQWLVRPLMHDDNPA